MAFVFNYNHRRCTLKSGIIAFAFGTPKTIRSNRWISQIASQKACELRAPVYTQLDICIDADIKVEFTKEHSGNPPPTLRIARGAVQWAKRNNITILWVVAAKPHLWRCIRDLTRATREINAQIEINICEKIEQYPEDEWFCIDSTQERTRSQKNWIGRERILKLLPFFIYQIIAS